MATSFSTLRQAAVDALGDLDTLGLSLDALPERDPQDAGINWSPEDCEKSFLPLRETMAAVAAELHAPPPGEGLAAMWLRGVGRGADIVVEATKTRHDGDHRRQLAAQCELSWLVNNAQVALGRLLDFVDHLRPPAESFAAIVAPRSIASPTTRLRLLAERAEAWWNSQPVPPLYSKTEVRDRVEEQRAKLRQGLVPLAREAGGLILEAINGGEIASDERLDWLTLSAVGPGFDDSFDAERIFRRLVCQWLPERIPGYGGQAPDSWRYPGVEIARRDVLGIRYARCMTGMADALDESASVTAPAPAVIHLPSTPVPSRQELFESLLVQFRQAHAAREHRSFYLKLYLEEDIDNLQKVGPRDVIFRDASVLSPHAMAYAGSTDLMWHDRFIVVAHGSSPNSAANWKAWVALAEQAGAIVPKSIRADLGGESERPIDTFLSLFFWVRVPRIHLEKVYGGGGLMSYAPFLDAADVVEECKLNTADHRLPPALLAYTDRRRSTVRQSITTEQTVETPEVAATTTGAATLTTQLMSSESNEGTKAGASAGPVAALTVEQANEVAMKLAEKDAAFVMKTLREWAAAIGCSAATVGKTKMWQGTMERTDRGRKGKPNKPKTVSLTSEIEAMIGDVDIREDLDELIQEQREDSEASPLDPIGRHPKSYRR